MPRYRKAAAQAIPEVEPVRQSLNDMILLQLQEWIPRLVASEIEEHLGRRRYERDPESQKRDYRNGYHKERSLTCGVGTVPVQLPRLRAPFESQIVKRYQRCTDEVQQVLPELYLHGLSTGDFQYALQGMLGKNAPLSPPTIVRMKKEWEEEYRLWKKRALESEYLYVWADGVYPKAGPKDEKMAVLVLVGVNRTGTKEILAIEEGYRESYESWREIFRNLKKRGVRWIGLTIADGLDGFRQAVRDVYPTAKHQRCFIHKMRNVLDKLPTKLHDEALEALREMYHAQTKQQALALKRAFILRYGKVYPKAVKSLNEAGELLFTYFDFPKVHWISIKSTNVIESLFNAVKLRTNVARRIPNRDSALFLVFKLLTTQQLRLHKIHGYRNVAERIDFLKYPSLRRNAA